MPSQSIRIWIAGCATGEEAYSIAILIAEAMGGLSELRKSRVQIFATDIDSRALEVARSGSYPATAANDIPAEYLGKYFSIDGGHWPPRTLARYQWEGRVVLATVGVSICRQPGIAQFIENPSSLRRFEWAACFESDLPEDLIDSGPLGLD